MESIRILVIFSLSAVLSFLMVYCCYIYLNHSSLWHTIKCMLLHSIKWKYLKKDQISILKTLFQMLITKLMMVITRVWIVYFTFIPSFLRSLLFQISEWFIIFFLCPSKLQVHSWTRSFLWWANQRSLIKSNFRSTFRWRLTNILEWYNKRDH